MILTRWLAIAYLAALLVFAGPLQSALVAAEKDAAGLDPSALPAADTIQSIEIYPAAVILNGSDDAQQLILSARLTSGRIQDLTSAATYEAADPRLVRVTSTGRVFPVGNAETAITVSYAGKSVKVPVKAERCDVNLPINFGNQVVPIFTKLGCNSGGCHGKASGQNGFKLSLLGFDPELDYMTLVKENRGRRLFPAAPDSSLVLTKAAGIIAHGGGKRLEVQSDEWKVIRRWIAAGVPFGDKTDPVVTHLTVYPPHRIMTRQNRQQFAAYAHYSDGSVEDITRRAQYESNDQDIAVVDGNGLVRTLAMSGEAAIMIRYQSLVTTFRATVPLGAKVPDWKFEPQTLVDGHTARKWKELGLVPSDLCTDEQFIRRLSIDLTGTLPTPAQVLAFVQDTDPARRDKLSERLLDSPEYTFFFANKWADILRVKRRGEPNRAKGTFAFHDWIRQAVARDMPYDEMARNVLGASGDEVNNPPTVWYKELTTPEQFVDDTAQVFLGQRLACAQCHHHPYEKWSQDDYWGLAAFFGRVGRKHVLVPGEETGQPIGRESIHNLSAGGVTNKRTSQPAIMKTLGGNPVVASRDEDPRHLLIDWMVDAKNPFFARAVANRYWAHFFARGIVDPLDDMRVTNPPSNPELLDALAQDLIDHQFHLKDLIRTIVKSRTYQLSAVPNDFNKHDKQNYARYYPRRLSAEVLLDAVDQVTNATTAFGLPQDRHAPRRAIMLPDESFSSYFLDVFGRPQRISACECERVSEANLAQALHLLNSDEVQGKLSWGTGRAALLARDPRSEADKVDELFLWALGRKPTAVQRDLALTQVAKHAQNKKVAYENLLWALLNTKEFVFNQ
jgi:hypothetical protein